MTRCLILCAGNGVRWGDYMGVPKQLIKINDETLLHRTLRLLKENDKSRISIVTNDDRLRLGYHNEFQPRRSRWIVETVLSTRELWEERVIVLLGDVFYTEQAMHEITKFSDDLGFFGRPGPSRYTARNHGEIFAVSFSRGVAERFTQVALLTLECAVNGAWGNLWDLYHTYVGMPLNSKKFESRIFHIIDDFTDDFDIPADYCRANSRYRITTSGNVLQKNVLEAWILFLAPAYWTASVLGIGKFKKRLKYV
jgi:hypothetical protein